MGRQRWGIKNSTQIKHQDWYIKEKAATLTPEVCEYI